MSGTFLRVAAPCAGIVAASILPAIAGAQWSPEGTPVCTAARAQSAPVAASDGAGGFILAWTDLRNGNLDVYAQRVNAAGAALWASDGVPVCTARGDQGTPSIAADGAGGAFVVWHDYRCGSRLFAQRLGAAGQTRWPLDGVPLCAIVGWQLEPRCAADGFGGLLVTWAGDSRGGLHAQHIGGGGAIGWGAGGTQVTTSFAFDPRIVADGAGGAFVAYVVAGAGHNTIVAQRLDVTGASVWAAGGVLLNPPFNYSAHPALAPDGAGGTIVAWADARAGNALHIFAQRLDASGATQWTPNGVALCTAPIGQEHPVVAATGAHGAIVAWLDSRNGGRDVFARAVGPAGDTLWATYGVPVCSAGGDQSGLLIARDQAEGAIVAWQDHRGTSWDIYAQRLSAAGASLWAADGVPLSVAGGDQTLPTAVADGASGLVTAWSDARTSAASSDIYAARVDSNGVAPAIVGVPSPPPRPFRRVAAAPNPLVARTTLSFETATSADVSVEIYDLHGTRVRTLVAGRPFDAGPHTLVWDGRDAHGARVSSGVYYARVRVSGTAAMAKVVVLR